MTGDGDSTLLVRMLTDIKGDLKSLSDRLDSNMQSFEAKLESKVSRQEYEARHRTLAEQLADVRTGANTQAAMLRSDLEALDVKVDSIEQRRSAAARDVNMRAWGGIASGVIGIVASVVTWLIIGV